MVHTHCRISRRLDRSVVSIVGRILLIALLCARVSTFSVHHQRSSHQLQPFGTHQTPTTTRLFAGLDRLTDTFGLDDDDDDDDDEERVEAGFGSLSEDEEDDEEEREWLSDMEMVRRAAQTTGGEALTNRNKDTLQKFGAAGGLEVAQLADPSDRGDAVRDEDYELLRDEDIEDENASIIQQESIYDEDELELINEMGGFQPIDPHPSDGNDDFTNADRETGYLGDSTLMDISHDYTVPICYVADVLTTWGIEPPIDVNAKLGDLVTGEQAFSLLEGLTTLDVDVLNRNYSDDDLMEVCEEYEISIRDAFTFCKTEKYNLPFGVRTFLRVDQEETLVRMLAPNLYGGVSDKDLDGDFDEDDPDGLTMEDIARMQPMED